MTISDDVRDLTDGGGVKLSTIIHLVSYAGLILIVVMLVKFWMDESIGRARAEATSQAEKRVQESADARIAERDKIFLTEIASLKAENSQIRTQQQAVRVIEKYIPTAAPAVQVTKDDIKPVTAAKLPDSPGYTIRTEAQEIELAKNINQCQQDKAGLTNCEANKADLTAKLDSAKRERDEWQKAARGGSKWKRLGKSLKVLGCAGAGAALGGLSKRPAPGAAVGAVAGGALCSVF